jgi:hypothetical protein
MPRREITHHDTVLIWSKLPSGEEVKHGGRFTGISVEDNGTICLDFAEEFEGEPELTSAGSVPFAWITRIEVVQP